jgi:hypothetical protein
VSGNEIFPDVLHGLLQVIATPFVDESVPGPASFSHAYERPADCGVDADPFRSKTYVPPPDSVIVAPSARAVPS